MLTTRHLPPEIEAKTNPALILIYPALILRAQDPGADAGLDAADACHSSALLMASLFIASASMAPPHDAGLEHLQAWHLSLWHL